jgi:hypothetical protein
MSPSATHDLRIPSWTEWLIAVVLSGCLSAFVWKGLLFGGGLVGGDTYPYFFPQKQLLADSLTRGEIPLWHDRTSLGYPLHAESQAGIFYPSNQLLYRLVEINTAYSFSVLLHYAAAFLMTWRFGRSQSLSNLSAFFAAIIFVYGWFPVRVSLEWSIIGGVWFPLCLWMVERLLEKPSPWRWTLLAMSLGVHLLAGHFALAFITQLTCLAFAFLTSPSSAVLTDLSLSPTGLGSSRWLNRWKASALVIGAIVAAVLLAAVQLVPTLELRQLSQRDGVHTVFNPAYGHMPPVYLTQLVASWWYWHTPEMAMSREMLKYPFLQSPAETNPVEAHLYLGLIPLLLLISLASANVRRLLKNSAWKTWVVLSVAGIIYAFGWLVPVFRYLPGFGFFMGPGRYTMISAMGLAIVAGLALDVLLRRRKGLTRSLIVMTFAAITLCDVLASSQYPVCDAQVVATPPLAGLKDSWLAETLQAEDGESPVRLLSGGPNIGNLFGVSSVPQYLGLGPAEYFSDDAALQTQPASPEIRFPSDEQLARLKALAVTHILVTESNTLMSDECELVGSGPDSFLNRVWARGNADCFLYRLKNPKRRITTSPATALNTVNIVKRDPSEVEFQVDLNSAAVVELTELMFPGWSVTVDSQEAVSETNSGFGRLVKVDAGLHTVRWTYRPRSFQAGLLISVVAAIAMGLLCVRVRRSFRRI